MANAVLARSLAPLRCVTHSTVDSVEYETQRPIYHPDIIDIDSRHLFDSQVYEIKKKKKRSEVLKK